MYVDLSRLKWSWVWIGAPLFFIVLGVICTVFRGETLWCVKILVHYCKGFHKYCRIEI